MKIGVDFDLFWAGNKSMAVVWEGLLIIIFSSQMFSPLWHYAVHEVCLLCTGYVMLSLY